MYFFCYEHPNNDFAKPSFIDVSGASGILIQRPDLLNVDEAMYTQAFGVLRVISTYQQQYLLHFFVMNSSLPLANTIFQMPVETEEPLEWAVIDNLLHMYHTTFTWKVGYIGPNKPSLSGLDISRKPAAYFFHRNHIRNHATYVEGNSKASNNDIRI